MARACIHSDLASTRTQRRAGHIHGHITGTDDRHVLPDRHARGIDQVIDTKQHVAARLAGNAQFAGTPGTGTNKDRIVAVAQQVVDMQRATDGGRGAHAHAKRAHHMTVLLHERTGQAELGDTVFQHTADLGALFKYRDGTA